ncbi:MULTISPECIES: pseudaminic acid cytidylyltransferase [Halomonadaceae]|uniref:pseudaminic acid cytidylyltransferase n=1 Tax=Halomonadaceae TaxID=28256 RepID=UPI0012F01831|nr:MULTISPECIES: pseudaminic acid cytidylyltransferase [Halomonas]CAD5257080.1 Pseudaminic acid cytidylyltransferase [Halomonas sp. 59]CAD5257312.1 Pseudaminic acid cytidylyltransferase [Halomonas sp. 113]CAD5271153.1 Pseudaminic acid cytidylyltransferase [Halomonas sp. I3]CAD5291558.1 Pseudaminic acid cytidylyltransferase [Halomonas sp. 156]VXB23615.1 Pseudaminic acid cytidylyltransferase [Halomonas titanicae]
MNRIAIIPARGGSKRIPRKNIKDFCGKPMMAWSIEAAKASGCFDRIIVSTDDREIAKVAEQWGAEAPFLRPNDLADDYTGTLPVIRHAVEWVNDHEMIVGYACCVYATAPFVTPEDIQRGWELMQQSVASFVFSVTSYAFPIQRAIRITENGRVAMFNPEHFQTRSQDLEEAWHDAGQFYWGTADSWLEEKMIFGEDSVLVKLPRNRVQDIDTPEDWARAEWLFKAMQAEMETQ